MQTSSVDATGLGSLQFRSNSPPLLAKMAIYPDSYNSSKYWFSFWMLVAKDICCFSFVFFSRKMAFFRPPKISAASLCGVICPVEVKSISDGSRISGLFFIFAAESKEFVHIYIFFPCLVSILKYCHISTLICSPTGG